MGIPLQGPGTSWMQRSFDYASPFASGWADFAQDDIAFELCRAHRRNARCVGQYTSSGTKIRDRNRYHNPGNMCCSRKNGPRAQLTSCSGRQKKLIGTTTHAVTV